MTSLACNRVCARRQRDRESQAHALEFPEEPKRFRRDLGGSFGECRSSARSPGEDRGRQCLDSSSTISPCIAPALLPAWLPLYGN